jgi:hypothetical protein
VEDAGPCEAETWLADAVLAVDPASTPRTKTCPWGPRFGGLACSDKIAQGFRTLVWNPDCREIAGTVTACQLQSVQPIRLDPLAWLLRNKSWRNNRALNSQLSQLPVEYEARRAGFIAGPQLLSGTKLLDQLPDRFLAVGYRTQAAYLAIRLGYGYGYRFGMDIQTQKS